MIILMEVRTFRKRPTENVEAAPSEVHIPSAPARLQPPSPHRKNTDTDDACYYRGSCVSVPSVKHTSKATFGRSLCTLGSEH